MSKFTVLKNDSTNGMVKAWIDDVPVEEDAKDQLLNIASMPFIYKWVCGMPDIHFGMGACIGSVIPSLGAIIPAAVGVDIGCGMDAVKTSLTADDLPDDLSGIRKMIERVVPHGRTDNGGKNDRGAWGKIPKRVQRLWDAELAEGYDQIIKDHPKLKKANSLRHLGSLGTGNHFIEVCLDGNNDVWVMLHSGSRGIGNKIGSYFIQLAKQGMKKWFVELPDDNLAYFPQDSQGFRDYMFAVHWAQKFARLNRKIMMDSVIEALTKAYEIPLFDTELSISCHHNYVAQENHFGQNVWVTRKGAVRAREGDWGIIPGSMGAKSYIVKGKGDSDSFHSCSHGAGRKMSRNKAKKTFTVEDHIKATEGIECRKDASVLDETPGAYKDIDNVMAAQQDLVEPVYTLRQVLCVKG
jgi:tRNA-splicing ligase RtcB